MLLHVCVLLAAAAALVGPEHALHLTDGTETLAVWTCRSWAVINHPMNRNPVRPPGPHLAVQAGCCVRRPL